MSRIHTPPRRAIGLGVVVALIGAAAVALLVSGCGGTTATETAQAPTRTKPLETIFEAPTELWENPGPTLDELKRLGVGRVKVFMHWADVAPDPTSHTQPHFDASSPAAYPAAGWTHYDAIVRAAAARGIGLDLALLAKVPLWATAPGVPKGATSSYPGVWEPSAQEFGLFVRAVATRYSGHYKPPGASSSLPRVDFWSMWNEPNYGTQLAPQAIDHSTVEVSPAMYRRLLDAAWSALQATGHGHDTVLIGEIAPRGLTLGDVPGNFAGMVPLRFIPALYCVDASLRPLQGEAAVERSCPSTSAGSKAFPANHPALFQAAGFAFHPYPQVDAPNVVSAPDGLGAQYADFPQLAALERTLDGAIAAYGSGTRFPLYNTEFGYKTNPPLAGAVDPGQAAAWANQAEYMSWRDGRVVSWDQYLLADPQPGTSDFVTGLEFFGGKHKATYDAFRMPIYLPITTAASGHSLEVWGCVRPAHYAMQHSEAQQVAQVQFQPAAGGPFTTVKRVTLTDPFGYFDTLVTFPSSGNVRITWSYPHGPTIHSRTVAITIR
jgi:hypothetical protein